MKKVMTPPRMLITLVMRKMMMEEVIAMKMIVVRMILVKKVEVIKETKLENLVKVK